MRVGPTNSQLFGVAIAQLTTTGLPDIVVTDNANGRCT